MARYEILTDEDLSRLSRGVNEFVKGGWQPVGGPFMYTAYMESFTSSHVPRSHFAQALIHQEGAWHDWY